MEAFDADGGDEWVRGVVTEGVVGGLRAECGCGEGGWVGGCEAVD